MTKIFDTLNRINAALTLKQPKTMDELIEIVHAVDGAGNYGTSFHIVRHKGYLQGVRVYVTGRKNSYPLPNRNKVYSVFQGIEKYEAAGYPVDND